MSDRAQLARKLATAARDAARGAGAEVWRVRLSAGAGSAIGVVVASSRGRLRIDVPAPAGASADLLCAYVWGAVRDALEEQDRRTRAPAPDLVEHVVGFRAWQLAGSALAPVGMGLKTWDGGNEVRAVCGAVERFRRRTGAVVYTREGSPRPWFAWHEAPDATCDCGLYAWHEAQAVATQAGRRCKVVGPSPCAA